MDQWRRRQVLLFSEFPSAIVKCLIFLVKHFDFIGIWQDLNQTVGNIRVILFAIAG